MQFKKQTIRGKKGKNICYTIANFRYNETEKKISWDAWRFYSAKSVQKDDEGFGYIDVPAAEIDVTPDALLDKDLIVVVSTEGVNVYITLEGETGPGITITDASGDIVISGTIPSTLSGEEPVIYYKEVINV
jgi:hypothetical protein